MFSAIYYRIQALFMSLSVLAQGIFFWTSYPCPKVNHDGGEIISTFKNKDGRVMSMAHRADWKNYPENSIPAMQSCIDMGADVIEIDVQRTADGVIVLSHDGTIDRMTNGKGRIADMTYEEILKYNLKQGQGGIGNFITPYKIPAFTEVLDLCRGKIMLNIDKGMNYKDEIRDLLDEYDSLGNCYFVDSTPFAEIEAWFAQLRAAGKKLPMFGCKMKNPDIQFAQEYIKSHLAGGYSPIIEMSFKDDTWAAGKPEIVSLAREGMRINGNPITASKSGGHKDDETGWSYLINLGYNVLQTDHIHELVGYLYAINNVRMASSDIEAEHFNNSSGGRVTLADKSLNKILYSLNPGDSAEYKKIDFGTGKMNISMRVCGLAGGTVEVYIDNTLAGKVQVPLSASMKTVSASVAGASGIHSICLKIAGGKMTNIRIDRFNFS